MIQRIQSLYMIIALVVLVTLSTFQAVWVTPTLSLGIWDYTFTKVLLMMISALIAVNIFQYKDRKRQFVLNRVAILLSFIMFGYCLFTYYYEIGPTEENRLDNGVLGPLLTVVFLSLANRGIKKDDELIKSMDRLR